MFLDDFTFFNQLLREYGYLILSIFIIIFSVLFIIVYIITLFILYIIFNKQNSPLAKIKVLEIGWLRLYKWLKHVQNEQYHDHSALLWQVQAYFRFHAHWFSLIGQSDHSVANQPPNK